jgi:urea transporter
LLNCAVVVLEKFLAKALAQLVTLILRGYGQVLFCNSLLCGVLFLVGTFYDPVLGLLGVAGAIAATLTALVLRCPEPYVDAGIFGCNGALVGLAWGMYFQPTPALFVSTVLAGALAAVLAAFLISVMKSSDLPVLSIAFVVAAWVGLAGHAELVARGSTLFTLRASAKDAMDASLPAVVAMPLRSLGSCFFEGNAFTGFLCLIGILLYSRLLGIAAIASAFLAAVVMWFFGLHSTAISSGTLTFNAVLVGMALGGFFIVANWRSAVYAAFGVACCSLVTLAMLKLFAPLGVAPLAAPFNLVALLFLIPLKNRFVPEALTKFHPVPLAVAGPPEKTLEWHEALSAGARRQQVRLSLPVFGTWLVTQGNNSKPTHQGADAFAWDFVVVDEEARHFRPPGARCTDFFAFAMPVVAPAGGSVVKVVNNVPDNQIGETNKEQNWGNLVLIDHGAGEYSELSHFKEGSIAVKEGDFVVEGQLLGYCGNSGRSAEPHLHYQLQSGPYIGAATISARFGAFLASAVAGTGAELRFDAVPQEKERVGRFEKTAELAALRYFAFVGGRKWRYGSGGAAAEEWTATMLPEGQLEIAATRDGVASRCLMTTKDGLLLMTCVKSPGGVFGGGMQGLETVLDCFAHGFPITPLVARPGISWKTETEAAPALSFMKRVLDGGRKADVECRIVGTETLSIGARQLECLRLQSRVKLGGRALYDLDVWLARDEGLARAEVRRDGAVTMSCELSLEPAK